MKILDASGTVAVEYTYDAWGNCVFDPDSTTNRTLAVNNPFRYRSYYYDKDSKLYFLQSRYYDPSIGRFISSDDIAYLGATGTVLSYNMFAYCENDVLNGIDPNGTALQIIRAAAVFVKATKVAVSVKAYMNYIYNLANNFDGLFVYNQNHPIVGKMKIGTATTMSKVGCEVIALYNAILWWKLWNGFGISQSYTLADAIYELENLGYLYEPTATLGCNPRTLGKYLSEKGISYKTCYTTSNLKSNLKKDGDVAILSYWNDKIKFYYGLHTITLVYYEGKYFTFNNSAKRNEMDEYTDISKIIGTGRYIISYVLKNK